MKAVLKCRLSSDKVLEITPYMFNKVDFKGSLIISGDTYYVKKALSLGAKQKAKPKQAEKKEP